MENLKTFNISCEITYSTSPDVMGFTLSIASQFKKRQKDSNNK